MTGSDIITCIPKKIIDELISRTNIIDLINKRVPLQKKGINFTACCPFHSEKHPSFTVNFKKQFYYCFSCGSHGNVINFLMNYDQLTFIESIQELSRMHNISIKPFLNITKNELIVHKNNLYQFMNDLCIYYQNNLMNQKYIYAYKYLKNRGLTHNSILNFNIGFAPTGWNNIIRNFDDSMLYDQKSIIQSGMLVKNQNNQYDRFRARIMFPIRNEFGKIIAFGGRVIQHTTNAPKYLNSPDTKIFQKNRCLYGFYETRKKHKNIPYILLVEGYIDVIILTQFGIDYSVASLGTSITSQHIQLLYNITSRIICCYDGDRAGKQAAWRTLNVSLSHLIDGREIHFMFLPNSEDPDTLIRKIGKNNFLKKVSQAQNLSCFLFETLSKKVNLQTLEGRVKLSSLILPMINKIPGQTLRLCLRQQLGHKIGILDDNKLDQLLSIKPILETTNNKQKDQIKYNIEHILIGLLIQNPKLAKLVPTIQELKKFKHNKTVVVFVDLVQICKSNSILTTEQLLQHYNHNNKNNFFLDLKTLANWDHMISNDTIEIAFIDALAKLYNLILEQRQDMLIARARTFGLTTKERQELWSLNQTLSIR